MSKSKIDLAADVYPVTPEKLAAVTDLEIIDGIIAIRVMKWGFAEDSDYYFSDIGHPIRPIASFSPSRIEDQARRLASEIGIEYTTPEDTARRAILEKGMS